MPDEAQEQPAPAVPERVVVRIPGTALLVALAIAVCATPIAFAAPGLQAVYLLPIAVGYWVLRNRTTVDTERIVARATFSTTSMAWSEVTSLRVTERSWVRAVLADEREVPLPAVRLRHLSMLALVTDGRIPDPNARTEPSERDEPKNADDAVGE